jgi:hypothetical protein
LYQCLFHQKESTLSKLVFKMETQQRTPVEIVQELIAVHTTRKEASEKIMQNGAASDLSGQADKAAKQSEGFIAELMSELSQFGDAVGAEAARDNPYQERYKQALPQLESGDASALQQSFQQLEKELHETYQQITETQTGLPESVKEIIGRQQQALG